MKKYILVGFLAITGIAGLNAQVTLSPTVLASAGGYSESGNISLSWTLGDLAVTTLTGGDLVLTQGFQQPYAIGTGIKPSAGVSWNLLAYPNPVNRELHLRFEMDQPADFFIEITDVSGRLISLQQYRQITPGEILPIEMQDYKQGIYFFKVFTPDRTMLSVLSITKI